MVSGMALNEVIIREGVKPSYFSSNIFESNGLYYYRAYFPPFVKNILLQT